MTMHAQIPTIASIEWLQLNLDLLVVIYLQILNVLSFLAAVYFKEFWCMERSM